MTSHVDLEGTRIRIPGTNNVRDLGGYPAADGRVIAAGRVFRAEALAMPGASQVNAIWDEAHREHYAALELTTIVDLRTSTESRRTPSAWSNATGATCVSIPIEEGAEGSDTDVMGRLRSGELSRFTADDLGDLYIASLERRAEPYGRALMVLADPDRLPALVHCAAGKDRTGLLTALLLGVLGTPHDLIVRDYELTGRFRPNRVEAYADVFGSLGLAADDVRALFETPGAAMERALQHLAVTYGGAAGYLVQKGGLRREALERLRENLLADVRPDAH